MSSEAKCNADEKIVKMPAWFDNTGPDTDVVTSTRIRLARNLNNHRFPFSATTSERKKIFEEISSVLKKGASRFRNFELVNFSGLKKLEQMYLVEERIVSPDMLKIDGDRGVAFDTTGRINIMINEEDHIRMQCLDSGFRPDQIWKVIDILDDTLGEKLDFAFNQQIGFLTCCPTNSGTGMRVSFLMHLPGLVLAKAIDAVLLGVSQMGVSTRGFFGEHSDVVGNYFQLSNQATMGAHEQEFIENAQKIISDVIDNERKARERILKDAKLELTDKVFRAYGILTNARTLSLPECLNLTSAVRVGIDCGLFDLITIEELNRITLLAMPAHLQVYLDLKMDETELGIERANLVRELLTKRKRRRNTSRS